MGIFLMKNQEDLSRTKIISGSSRKKKNLKDDAHNAAFSLLLSERQIHDFFISVLNRIQF